MQQQNPTVSPQAVYTSCQPLQPTSGNGPPNLYCGPSSQQRAGQPLYNQQNEGGYRPNYPQLPRVYHGEIGDSQFEDYKNDYYNNSQFEQEDGWVNYIIDEDRAFQEAYEEEVNQDVNANYAVEQASYHCRRCTEAFSSNNTLHKHVQSDHNPGFIKERKDITQGTELKSAYLLTLNKSLVQSNATNISAKGYGF